MSDRLQPIGSRGPAERSLALAADARRRLAAKSRSPRSRARRGRLWLNGRELGDRDGRFAQLTGSYD